MSLYYLDLFGVVVFAISGALAAGQRRMDLFGVVVLALVTALGGGTLRDLVLDTGPVFWVRDPLYIVLVSLTAIATFALAHRVRIPSGALNVADAFGLAVFTVIGAQVGLAQTGSPVIAVMMGVMTGVVGGMLRDVLANKVPLVLRREIYASAAFCGALVLVLAELSGLTAGPAAVLSMAVTLGLRLAALRWGLALPVFPAGR